MDAKAILDGLLEKSQRATQAGMQMAEERKIIPPAGNERTAMLKGAGAGALAAGAMALFFGSKGTRKFAKKAAKMGGTAALGGLAYKVYTDWQAQQSQSAQQSQQPPTAAPAPQLASSSAQAGVLNLDQFDFGTPIDKLAAQQANKRSESLMQAMISAARADGHVDDDEMNLITQQIHNLGLEQDVSQFLLAEMRKPVDVNRIAALADTRESAAEIYIASAMVVDIDDAQERTYLDNLGKALGLDAGLVEQLEAPLRG